MRFRLVILQQTRNSELAVLPVEEISLAPDPDADASAPEAPADSDDTNGTEAASASDAPAQAPHTEAPAAAQPAAPAVPTLPQTGTTGWMAGVLASLGSLLLACGWFFTRKSKHSVVDDNTVLNLVNIQHISSPPSVLWGLQAPAGS